MSSAEANYLASHSVDDTINTLRKVIIDLNDTGQPRNIDAAVMDAIIMLQAFQATQLSTTEVITVSAALDIATRHMSRNPDHPIVARFKDLQEKFPPIDDSQFREDMARRMREGQ
jgi:uncharacterized protein (UPF0147 family)